MNKPASNQYLRSLVKKSVLLGISALTIGALLLPSIPPATSDHAALANGTFTDQFSLTKLAQYQAAPPNADGGVAEIVTYNSENNKFYLVNGAANPPSMDIVTLGTSGNLTLDKRVNIKTTVETGGYLFGDLSSIDVNTTINRVFVAVQAAGAASPGKIVEFDYDGNLIAEFQTGAQPDMIVSTKDGKYVLTADEGEPRVAGTDPRGGVTVLDTVNDTVKHLQFDNPAIIDDLVHIRGASHPTTGVISTKGTKADALFDLEPEYITISEDGNKAFVSLQENNAIATLDLNTQTFTSVKGLGLKDHSQSENSLDLARDNTIKLENAPFYGIYNPDGIANLKVGNQTYLFTANEGDATDWPGRKNASSVNTLRGGLASGSAAATFLSGKTAYNSLEVASDMGNDSIYLYGARSFSIWNTADMKQVYDSGNQFERITSERLPAVFNASHSNTTMDNRSARKGPEPEAIEVGNIGDRHYAFIALERIGGVMVYEVTDPTKPTFVNYTNTRVFTPSNNLNTDTGPEGLEFISGANSPTGWPLLLVANEVSGNVTVLQINRHDDQTAPTAPGQPFVSHTTDNLIRLSWPAARDNVRVTGYRVYDNGQPLATVRSTMFDLLRPTADENRTLTVTALDQAGNESVASSSVTVRTESGLPGSSWRLVNSAQHTAQTSFSTSNLGALQFTLNWTAPTGIVNIRRYELYRNGAYAGVVSQPRFTFTQLAPNSRHSVRILAIDANQVRTVLPDFVQVTTSASPITGDTKAPTVPQNVRSSLLSHDSFRISWNPSTDNLAVLGYIVTHNGRQVAYTTSTSFTIRGLSPSSSHQISVQAYDHALNRSSASPILTVTTTVRP